MGSWWNFKVRNWWNERGRKKYMKIWWCEVRSQFQVYGLLMEEKLPDALWRPWEDTGIMWCIPLVVFCCFNYLVSPLAPNIICVKTVYLSEWCFCFFSHQLEVSVVHVKLQLLLWKCLLYLRRCVWEYVSYYLAVIYFYFMCWRESGHFKMEDSVFSPCWLPAVTIWAGIFQALSVSYSTHHLSLGNLCKIAYVFPKIRLRKKTFLFHGPFNLMLL